MANQHHLAILAQGIEIWNQWRADHPTLRPDLRGANLEQADLYQINFSNTYLAGANLSRAYLLDADLRAANLRDANLCRSCLIGSTLSQAYLSGADLQQAYLFRANLEAAYLRDANLQQADLTETTLNQAFLQGANLSLADFRSAVELPLAQIQRAIGWEQADYDPHWRTELGLPAAVPASGVCELEQLAPDLHPSMHIGLRYQALEIARQR